MNLTPCPPYVTGEKKRSGPGCRFHKLKLAVAIIFIACCNVTASVMAQQITLNVKNAPLESVFNTIKEQSGYTFLYRDSYLERTKKVTLKLSKVSLETALNACFKDQPLNYEIVGKTIVVKIKDNSSDLPAKTSRDRLIQGRVTDTAAAPLPGVSVRVKNGTVGTVTNTSGEFSLSVPENAILTFSYIGFETVLVSAEGVSPYRITMHRSSSRLDEVQVIAYGTTTRRLSTGNIGTVKAADIETQPVSNPMAALQGRIPGLLITQSSGVSGSYFKVQLRGQSSLDLSLSQNNPLFVIDGVPFESGNSISNQITSAANNPVSISSGGLSPLNSINPQDIESIDVLKDADATAIYGSRGANGVILITTKKGKQGKITVNLNVNSGVSRIGRSVQMMNTRQYVAIRKEAFRNDGLSPSADASDAGYAPDIMLWDTTRYTDFKKLLIGNTAHYNNFQGSISGGNNLTSFRISGNYHRETMVFPGSYTDQVASANANINSRSADGKFNVQLSVIYSSDHNQLPQYDLTKYLSLPPNLLLYNADGSLAWQDKEVLYNSLDQITNPLAMLNQTYQSTNDNLSGNLSLKYQLVAGLSAKVNLGYNSFMVAEKGLNPSTSIDPNLVGVIYPSSQFGSGNNRNWIIEPQLNYQNTFSFGKIDVLLGNTLQHRSGKSSYMYGQNYSSDLLLNSIAAAGTVTASNTNVNYNYAAFFGRINYNLKDKYLLDITARRDGSSRFGPDRQWATFGAAGLAWIFSEEPFVRNLLPFISFGKFRASYGTTGSDQIGDYKYLNLWNNTAYGYNGTPGLIPSSPYNPQYNWEVNKKLEASVELGFIKDRILLNTTFYRNRSSNQLIRYVLPTQTGFSSVIRNFPGLVQNTGWEFTLTSKNIDAGRFKWSSNFNLTIPQNKLVSFPGLATSSYKSVYIEGKSLSVIQAYKYLGVDPQTGLYTFEDVNKDGVIYTGDLQEAGNRDPKFYGGLQNNISWKQFDLSFFFQFTKQIGVNYLAQLVSTTPGRMYNQPEFVLSRWQQPGDQTDIEKLISQFDGPAATAYGVLAGSTGAYTDASFIKLKNLSLSYRIGDIWLKKLKLNGCRIYLEGQNLLTITSYKGADPEMQNFYALPPLRTIVAGLQLNL
ncbi:SusC/RagA family TonB-linked outer membrane protein [Mucilaginibacter sp. UC70_90]